MARVCTICAHPNRAAIDRALVMGASVRELAARYGTIGRMALNRHQQNGHIAARIAKAEGAAEATSAAELLTQVRALQAKATRLLLKAETEGDYRTALAGVREARGCVELLARLLGELDTSPQINVLLAPEWLQIRAVLMDALAPYTTARVAVAQALKQIETKVQ